MPWATKPMSARAAVSPIANPSPFPKRVCIHWYLLHQHPCERSFHLGTARERGDVAMSGPGSKGTPSYWRRLTGSFSPWRYRLARQRSVFTGRGDRFGPLRRHDKEVGRASRTLHQGRKDCADCVFQLRPVGSATRVAKPTPGGALKYTSQHNPFGPGVVCGMPGPYFFVVTTEWTESISAPANATLRCRAKR